MTAAALASVKPRRPATAAAPGARRPWPRPGLAAHLLFGAPPAPPAPGTPEPEHWAVQIAAADQPLPAEVFNGTLNPLARAADRAAQIAAIATHQAHLSIALAPRPGATPTGPGALAALHRATAEAARGNQPLALLWGPTGRLVSGMALAPLLSMKDPLSLYLAPRLAHLGPERRPALQLLGARARLGRALVFALGGQPPARIHAAALAFARAWLSGTVAPGRFHHEGLAFRLEARDAALILSPAAQAEAADQAAGEPAPLPAQPVSSAAISSGANR